MSASLALVNGSVAVDPLRRLVREYVDGRSARQEIVPGTARRERTVLLSFADSFGHRPVKNLSRRDIERWMADRGQLAPGTRRNDLNIVKRFCVWLQLEDHVVRNPSAGIKAPRVPRSVPRALTRDECDRLWAVLPDARAQAMVALMLGMGLRRGEVITLEVGDWDRRARTMRVTGKGGHTRLLPVPDHVAHYLDAYLATINARAGLLIRTYDGRRGISNCYIGMLTRAWMEAAGVKAAAHDGRACHSLRHTLASEVATIEPDLRVLQQVLGHQSLTSTQVYLRFADLDQMRSALDRADTPVR